MGAGQRIKMQQHRLIKFRLICKSITRCHVTFPESLVLHGTDLIHCNEKCDDHIDRREETGCYHELAPLKLMW